MHKRIAALVWCCLATACAGRTSGNSDTDGGTGPLATCGESCSASQIGAACESVCTKIDEAGCQNGDSHTKCVEGCGQSPARAPTCASTFVAFLRCLDTEVIRCSTNELVLKNCSAQSETFRACTSNAPTTDGSIRPGSTDTTRPRIADADTAPGIADAGSTDDPSVCPNIPRPTTTSGVCGGQGVGPGVDAAPQCSTFCQDSRGNLWESSCAGTTCTCTYNRTETCTCTMAATVSANGLCRSCCPNSL